MNVHRFRHLLRAILLAGVPVASVACSSTTDMPERAECVNVRLSARYTRLTLAPEIDGIALVTRGNGTSTRIDPLGAPCARATDRGACTRRVDELLADPASAAWTVNVSTCFGCESERLVDLGVITAGDDVRLATLDAVIGAALPIETRDEAAAVMAIRGGAFDCDENNVRPESDGWTFRTTRSSCSGKKVEYFSNVTRAGQINDAGQNEVSKGNNNCIEGRRPATLEPTGVAWLSSITACLGEIAHMEAASVVAFDDLAEQLRALAAPTSFQERVARARADEVEHARVTTDLARRFGVEPPSPRTAGSHAPKARLDVALENAVEGCVREAFGALVAGWQATHARDAEMRSMFATIAVDEADHAELSFDLDAWLAEGLSAAERGLVEDAKARAWVSLAEACDVEPSADVVRIAGMPTASEARSILAQLRDVACAVAA